MQLSVGTKVRCRFIVAGDDDSGVYREFPPGTVCEIDRVDQFPAPQNTAYTIVAPGGVVNVIDDTDKVDGAYPWDVVSE